MILKNPVLGKNTNGISNILDQIISGIEVPSEEKLSKGFI